MTTDWIAVLELYKGDTIEKRGKTEIQDEFIKHFGKSKDHFDKIVRKRIRLPTPLEEEFLTSIIKKYYKRYLNHKTDMNVDTKGQLSFEVPQSV